MVFSLVPHVNFTHHTVHCEQHYVLLRSGQIVAVFSIPEGHERDELGSSRRQKVGLHQFFMSCHRLIFIGCSYTVLGKAKVHVGEGADNPVIADGLYALLHRTGI